MAKTTNTSILCSYDHKGELLQKVAETDQLKDSLLEEEQRATDQLAEEKDSLLEEVEQRATDQLAEEKDSLLEVEEEQRATD